MASTRFNSDPSRIQKMTEESSFTGKYYLGTPSVQDGTFHSLPFYEDPHIRLQNWGANMMSNSIGIENELKGLNRHLNRDEPIAAGESPSQFSNKLFSQKIEYSTSKVLTTDETRASNPAWLLRGINIPRWENPIINPQASVERQTVNKLNAPPPRLIGGQVDIPDNGININTRILERDNYRPEYLTPAPAQIPFIPMAYPFM